jgi:hypothetical protein
VSYRFPQQSKEGFNMALSSDRLSFTLLEKINFVGSGAVREQTIHSV